MVDSKKDNSTNDPKLLDQEFLAKMKELRSEIDLIDDQLVSLIHQRASLVQKVGEVKQEFGKTFYDPKREDEIISRIIIPKNDSQTILPAAVMERIFRGLIQEYRSWESVSVSPLTQAETTHWTKHPWIVIGTGLIGASFILALKEALPEAKIISVDPVPLDAKVLNAIDSHVTSIDQLKIEKCNIVISTPAQVALTLTKQNLKLFQIADFILDMTSVKKNIVAQMQSLNLRFIGGHPLTGKSLSGSVHADINLFRAKSFVLCSNDIFNDQEMKSIHHLISALGSKVYTMSPADHDRMMAYTSALPQYISTLLTNVVREYAGHQSAELVFGNGLRDMTRLATSDYAMWKEIALLNSTYVEEALEEFLARFIRFKQKISAGDFEQDFALAKKFKEQRIP
jgi:prephenate dehydrogenase